jgi:hypothetical protein
MIMRVLRNLFAAAGIVLSTLAAASLIPAYAQVAPTTSTDQRQPVPRIFPDQQTAYIRTTFAFNSCTQASNVCTVKVKTASLPYNAAILRVTAVVHTAFNSTSTDVFTLGTTSANANELVSSGCSIHAQGVVACSVAAGASSAIGVSATQTGSNGGFDMYMKWTGGGGTPSTGLASIVVEYVMPNDGLCTTVPINGGTAAGC